MYTKSYSTGSDVIVKKKKKEHQRSSVCVHVCVCVFSQGLSALRTADKKALRRLHV